MNRIKYAIVLAAMLALGGFTATALAGNGHGNKPGDDTTAECQPAHGGESCTHNGDGHGNCGDNQGKGSKGNDNGFGHKGDDCAAAATTTTTGGTTSGTTGGTTTVTTPGSTVTTTTPGSTVTAAGSIGTPATHASGPPIHRATPARPVTTPANFTG